MVIYLTRESGPGTGAHYHSPIIIAVPMPREKKNGQATHFCYVSITPVFATHLRTAWC